MKESLRAIHVLHLIGSTGLYGAERWILALMRAADPARIRSTLINLVDSEGEDSSVVAAARQRGLDAFDFHTRGKMNPFCALRLARWAKGQRVDILHGHGFKSDTVGLLAAKLAGCKVMSTPHGWSMDAGRRLEIYEKLDRSLFRFMDMVCPLSSELEADVRGAVNPARLKLVRNGVDIDELDAVVPGARSDGAPYLIGYVGQLIERKDLSTLLAAVKLLSQKGLSVRLKLIGDGPKRNDLEVEAERLGISGISGFLGFKEDAASYLKSFDLFVLPSRMEGIPRCVMEAMAAAIPVVVSDIAGNRELVVEGETGLLFPVGDSGVLSEKIAFLMRHPEEAGRMASSGRQKIRAQYSSYKMARDYSTIYRSLVAGKESGVIESRKSEPASHIH